MSTPSDQSTTKLRDLPLGGEALNVGREGARVPLCNLPKLRKEEVQRAKKSFFQGTGGCAKMSRHDFQIKCFLVYSNGAGWGWGNFFHPV